MESLRWSCYFYMALVGFRANGKNMEEYHVLTTCSHVPSMVPTDPLIEYRSAHSRLTQTWGSMLYKDAAMQPQRQDAS